ncbi:MAG: hypothetical protein EOP53_08250 [Sphingobacteriales bacterium]|nr:MAG: hypothetical protein EOP53_08250 [Sphingobacteriales bacterium]
MKKIAPDKWRHFYAGIVLGIGLHAGTLFFLQMAALPAFFLALIFLIIISYGFELFSLVTGMGHYDFWDAVATVIGGIPGMALCFLL